MRVVIFIASLSMVVWAATLDPITCLLAKSNFRACAEYAERERFNLRECLNADSGYAHCRKASSPSMHARCLATKGQYAFCLTEFESSGLGHFECARADSGFKDCVELQGSAVQCLDAKGGYGACRKRFPELSHASCLGADAGYQDCLNAGGVHSLCLRARRSFSYCVERDRLSLHFCIEVGKGYQECRKTMSLAVCARADHGFGDCVEAQEDHR